MSQEATYVHPICREGKEIEYTRLSHGDIEFIPALFSPVTWYQYAVNLDKAILTISRLHVGLKNMEMQIARALVSSNLSGTVDTSGHLIAAMWLPQVQFAFYLDIVLLNLFDLYSPYGLYEWKESPDDSEPFHTLEDYNATISIIFDTMVLNPTTAWGPRDLKFNLIESNFQLAKVFFARVAERRNRLQRMKFQILTGEFDDYTLGAMANEECRHWKCESPNRECMDGAQTEHMNRVMTRNLPIAFNFKLAAKLMQSVVWGDMD
jgi:hypothetical protein